MKNKSHFKLLITVSLVWILFLILGSPNYYQQYSTTFMIAFDIAFILPIWGLGYRLMKKSKTPSKLGLSRIFATYFTLPFFIYDYLYCGIYLGFGWNFIIQFWYLSVFYIIPWLLLLPTGWWLDRVG